MKANANYTFIGYTVDSFSSNLHPEIGSVPFDIVQKDSSLSVVWKSKQGNSNYGSQDAGVQAVVRYARSDISPLREKTEKGTLFGGSLNLSATFEAFRIYQFCSRLYVGLLYGPDFCRTYRVLSPSVIGGASFDDALLRPVRCDHRGNECRCEQSYEFGDAMRVSWDWPADSYSADEFVVHYTLSDNVSDDDRLVIT
ncbi:unnamed protein product [Gongylonema pulchrum]|uniref:Uncharacterized protein n=1 Tax=Gongylonema pulchrum TaxID=637853 RepID=A0A3P6QYQ4_9BILA|nr:unnamed protein product [Gongylonema pulchrum]